MWSLVPLRHGKALNDAIAIPLSKDAIIGRKELLTETWRACGCREMGRRRRRRCDHCQRCKIWAMEMLSRRALQLNDDALGILQIRGKTTRKLLRINGIRVNQFLLLPQDENSWAPALPETIQHGTILTFQSEEHPHAILEFRIDYTEELREEASSAVEDLESMEALLDAHPSVEENNPKVASLNATAHESVQKLSQGHDSKSEGNDSSLQRDAVEAAESARNDTARLSSFKSMRMEESLQEEASDGCFYTNDVDAHSVRLSLETVDGSIGGGQDCSTEKSGKVAATASNTVDTTDLSMQPALYENEGMIESTNLVCGLQTCCHESSNEHEADDVVMEDLAGNSDDVAVDDEATPQEDKENQDSQISAQCTQDLLDKIAGDIEECEQKWPAVARESVVNQTIKAEASLQHDAHDDSRNPLLGESTMSTTTRTETQMLSSDETRRQDVAYSLVSDKQSGGDGAASSESSTTEGTQNAPATKKRRSGDGKIVSSIASGSPDEQPLSKHEPIELLSGGEVNASDLHMAHRQFRVMFIKLGYSCSTKVLPFKVKQAVAKGAIVVDLLEEKPTHLLIDPAVDAEKLADNLNFGKNKRGIRNLIKYLDEHEIVTVKVGDWIEGNGRLKTPTMKQLWSGLAPYRTKTLGQKRKVTQPSKLKLQPRLQELQSFVSNDAISLMFHKLAKLHQECCLMNNDEFRALTDNLISGRVKHLDFEITEHDLNRVSNIKGIGKSSVDKMKEFFQRGDGSCNRIEEFEKDKERMAVRAMQNIWGVGIKGAQQLMRLGYETIDQIRNDLDAGILEQQFPLNPNQKTGIKYYEDFLEKMSRKEVEQIAAIVREAVWERFPKANVTIMGSYRRGKETCGDIDLLITEPSYSKVTPRGALGELVSRLAERGHLSFHLTPNLEGIASGANESQSSYDCSQESILPPPNPTGGKPSSSSYMGVFCSPAVPGKMRRIDIKFYPYRERVFAALYFTGNGWFNRSMRRWAGSKNFSMDDHGLFPVARNQRAGPKIKSSVFYPSTEREVFDRLGLVYKEPTDRNYFDDVIPLDERVNDWDPYSMTERELMKDVAAHSGNWVD